MADEQTRDADVSASIVQGSQSEQITTTIDEVKNAEANAANAQPTADSLGVTPAQFDKFYKDGQYNWEAHAKEQQFILDQRGETQQGETQQEEVADPQDAVNKAGLDWDDLNYKIGANGDIDASDYQALMQLGIPEETIRTHVAMVSQQVQNHVAQVTEAFGGQEQWAQTQAWADRNLSQGEIDHLNQILAGPDYRMAVELLQQRAGTAMQTGVQSTPGTNQAQPYASQAEMVADMRKPEYKRDPAFRQSVQSRAAVSAFNQGAHTL